MCIQPFDSHEPLQRESKQVFHEGYERMLLPNPRNCLPRGLRKGRFRRASALDTPEKRPSLDAIRWNQNPSDARFRQLTLSHYREIALARFGYVVGAMAPVSPLATLR